MPEPIGRTPDKAAIRALDAEMVAALNARDLDRYMSCLADDVTWMPPGRPAVSGKVSVSVFVSALFEIPDFSVAHRPIAIEVSDGGDLAVMTYAYEFTTTDSRGVAVAENGKDLSVLRKVDGVWKLLIDMWNSDTAVENDPE